MMKTARLFLCLAIIALMTLWTVACSKEMHTPGLQDDSILLMVDEDALTVADFHHAEIWLPDFIQEMGSAYQIMLGRYSALVQLMLLANEAQRENLLTPAERSLAIKEGLANWYVERESMHVEVVENEEAIQAVMEKHPEQFEHPAQYVIIHALLHDTKRVELLATAYQMAYSAYAGISVEKEQENHHIIGFMTRFNENSEQSPLVGPFSFRDKIALTCAENGEILRKAEEGDLLKDNISCHTHWQSLAVVDKITPATDMTEQEKKNQALQIMIEQAKEARRAELLERE